MNLRNVRRARNFELQMISKVDVAEDEDEVCVCVMVEWKPDATEPVG